MGNKIVQDPCHLTAHIPTAFADHILTTMDQINLFIMTIMVHCFVALWLYAYPCLMGVYIPQMVECLNIQRLICSPEL